MHSFSIKLLEFTDHKNDASLKAFLNYFVLSSKTQIKILK